MTAERLPATLWIVLLAVVVLGFGAVVFGSRWWENRLYRQAEKLTGVGAPVLPGSVVEARRKVDSGMSSDKIVAAIGRPSLSVHTEGSSTHDIWTYYYADGTMKLNLTDGVIQRIALDYGPPQIPKSKRP